MVCLTSTVTCSFRDAGRAARMFQWLRKKKQDHRQPEYSALRAVPTRGFPPELTGMEGTPSFQDDAQAVQRELLEPSKRPTDDRPLFVVLLTTRTFDVRRRRGRG